MSAQSSIKSTPPSDRGSKPTSSKSTRVLSGVPSAAMSARSGIKSMAPSDKGSKPTSSKSTQARAKAEAAKVRLRYARQKAVLKMKLATREAEIQKERAARQREEAAREAEIQKERAARQREEAAREAEIQKERAARQREEAAREAEIQKERAARQREEAAREAEIQEERAAREAEKAARQREEAAREAETQLEMAKISTELQVLQREREDEAAMAEAKYIEEAEGSRDLTAVRSTLERTRLERTSDYVQYQIDRQARLPSPYVFDNFPSYEEPQRVTIASHPYKEGNLPSRLRDEVKNERTDNAPSPPQQDGGEGEVHSRTTIVSSNCTDVCGQTQSSRSCSEICLTEVYPKEAQQDITKRKVTDETLGQSVFVQTEHGNKLAQSAQDTISLKTKDTKVFRDEANNGVAPLPFREPRQRSPDNKEQAVKRFTSLRKTRKRKPEMQQHTRLAHEVLCTLMAEVTAIINAQSFLPVSSDPENPFILSPSTLHTQKAGAPPPPGDFSDKDLYTKQWRQVQALANQFWPRWRQKYLPLLQQRQKWTEPHRNLQVGDSPAQGQADHPQQQANGQNHCYIP
ncbi:GRB10-interacting GYF protein 2-like [Hypanus sabinus]|uniref:GRB10-interacting GYF protein 2-like n=1 Tax=Hypanus sabinus TaxID=79690 RepID=UPI0028C4A0FB|nr:GRB10-interacting GYF protein 2-like [Hypanus sabinus]XP_059812895.1 GRB10-interacting GYF protein 2-like [Hypanus sabinus]XP_059812906.1 GRB10-interacting GYF protein 2-like [Hypanus sabinus]XP_059812913.1 GRB10-interacting GYF protein 2-like [Hypanus sabinus]XP_059812922.1 GRB10-interacting GYF protein 2-like [Hypanus sabinus]XP_059812924.1 GRB10-interacting GYF protein 2-like [Hypanus sabinus]XP_059812925.1 GRB10-interacting GYF protein 2-like [Hypanus sabinus]